MSIFDYMNDQKVNKAYEKAHADAIAMFEKQKQAIQNIAESDGFKEIMRYLDAEIESLDTLMDSTRDKQAREEAFLEKKPLRKLKKFLENLAQ